MPYFLCKIKEKRKKNSKKKREKKGTSTFLPMLDIVVCVGSNKI
jgi:hypothetical protein